MKRGAITIGAGTTLMIAGCIDVADGRARRDEQVGRAVGDGLSVAVEQGLAAVTSLGAGAVTLWAQAPAFGLSIDRTAPPSGGGAGAPDDATVVTIENVLGDATLTSLDGGAVELLAPAPEAAVVPTVKRWRVSPANNVPPGGMAVAPVLRQSRLLLASPDWSDRTPFRFAMYADIQEKIGKVQDIYAKMAEDPRLRFALLSGDLTTRGTSAQLARFQNELKTLAFPVYATLGNHELGTRDDLFHDFFGRGSFSFTFRGARFTLLDSASATLAPLTYRWLDGWLSAGRDAFHLVAMHIPPLDPVGQRGGGFASRLEASMLVGRLAGGQVDVTVYGHVHSYYAFSNAGIPAYISGGGGAVPERLDGIGRHYLSIDVDPASQWFQVAVVRVD